MEKLIMCYEALLSAEKNWASLKGGFSIGGAEDGFSVVSSPALDAKRASAKEAIGEAEIALIRAFEAIDPDVASACFKASEVFRKYYGS